jgi:hypothetical protein
MSDHESNPPRAIADYSAAFHSKDVPGTWRIIGPTTLPSLEQPAHQIEASPDRLGRRRWYYLLPAR